MTYFFRNLVSAALIAALGFGSAAFAAESAEKADKDSVALDKLVANQPGSTPVAASQAESDKPMVINFSDFVKDGAGCGVPNLDTSTK
jgi:hypothetical protein